MTAQLQLQFQPRARLPLAGEAEALGAYLVAWRRERAAWTGTMTRPVVPGAQGAYRDACAKTTAAWAAVVDGRTEREEASP